MQLHNGSVTADSDINKAEMFNQYFYSVCTQSNSPLPNSANLQAPVNLLASISFTTEEVFDALIKLNVNKAGGIDNIRTSNCIKKLCSCTLSTYSSSIYD